MILNNRTRLSSTFPDLLSTLYRRAQSIFFHQLPHSGLKSYGPNSRKRGRGGEGVLHCRSGHSYKRRDPARPTQHLPDGWTVTQLAPAAWNDTPRHRMPNNGDTPLRTALQQRILHQNKGTVVQRGTGERKPRRSKAFSKEGNNNCVIRPFINFGSGSEGW